MFKESCRGSAPCYTEYLVSFFLNGNGLSLTVGDQIVRFPKLTSEDSKNSSSHLSRAADPMNEAPHYYLLEGNNGVGSFVGIVTGYNINFYVEISPGERYEGELEYNPMYRRIRGQASLTEGAAPSELRYDYLPRLAGKRLKTEAKPILRHQ